ncbi:MAG: hypothetical protein WC283_01795 [Candidatus Paceibacterota bacterium]
MNNLLGSGIINLILIGILIYGLVKHGIKGMLGLLVLCCLVAAIAQKPDIMIEFGNMILTLMKSLFEGA